MRAKVLAGVFVSLLLSGWGVYSLIILVSIMEMPNAGGEPIKLPWYQTIASLLFVYWLGGAMVLTIIKAVQWVIKDKKGEE